MSWKVDAPDDGGFGSYRIWSQEWGYIATLCGGSADEANARLISAAPELLLACQQFVHWYEADSSEHNRDVAFYSAKAAIERAAVK